jgi:hypothetical protein
MCVEIMLSRGILQSFSRIPATYEIREFLGAGGSGIVFRAYADSAKDVATKSREVSNRLSCSSGSGFTT